MEDPPPHRLRHAAAAHLAVIAAFAALAIVTTWPLVRHLRDHVVAHGPREATAALNIWSMAWVAHQLPRDPLHLFDANSFYPHARTLAFSEHLLVPALASAPIAAASGSWVLAYNVISLATLSLAGWGMYVLASTLTRDRLASFGAGALYAFHSWNVNEMVRLQILSNAWFPLLLAALVLYFREPRWRTAWAVALFYGLQSLSCMYWALYAPLLVVAAAVVLQVFHRRSGHDLVRLGSALAVPAIAVAAMLVPYLRVARELGFERGVPDSLPLDRYLAVLPGNLLYGSVLDTGGPNQNAAHFPGFAAIALAAAGLWRRDEIAGAAVRALLLVLIVSGFLLSLGPGIVAGDTLLAPGPYALLREWAPGFRNVRYPERFALFAMLGLAPAVALGLHTVRRRVGTVAAAALAALVWLEHVAVPLTLDPLAGGRDVPAVYHHLAGRADVAVTAEFPAFRHRLERFDALPMYLSTVHWKRTVEGFSGYFPPTYNFTKWRLLHFPAPESVAFLERFGVGALVIRPEGLARLAGASSGEWALEGPFDGGHLLLRLLRAAPAPAFPAPAASAEGLTEIPRSGWRAQASSPNAARAIDGDPATSWSTPDRQGKGDFFRISFAAPAVLSRITVSAIEPYEFPMRLRLLLQDEDGSSREVEFDREGAYDRLFARLLHEPRTAALDIDVPPQRVMGFRLRIAETDPFWMPWTMAELRAYGPR